MEHEALAAVGAVAFAFDGSFRFAAPVDLPTDPEAFDDADIRRRALPSEGFYRLVFRSRGRRWEETGRVALDSTITGILRPLDPVRAACPPALSRDDLLDALNGGRVRLAFQPIVAARTHRIKHYECLMRMLSESGEVLSAAQVIGSAERLGLVGLLDRRALEMAARTMIARTDLWLALNVSAQTVADRAQADDYLDALKMLGPAARRLTIELTETIAVDDPTMAARFATHARALGCRFAVDDFGSGYTSFRNLMAIEADAIKIDGDFIDGLLGSPRAQTFVRMMVDLAQTFGVETVAERVESRDVADTLAELGVDGLQGYYFGRPAMDVPQLRAA